MQLATCYTATHVNSTIVVFTYQYHVQIIILRPRRNGRQFADDIFVENFIEQNKFLNEGFTEICSSGSKEKYYSIGSRSEPTR